MKGFLKSALPWALLALVVVALVWTTCHDSQEYARFRAAMDSAKAGERAAVLALEAEQRIRRQLEVEVGRAGQEAAVAGMQQEEAGRRTDAAGRAHGEGLEARGDTAGLRSLQELEGTLHEEREATAVLVAAKDRQIAALGALVVSYRRDSANTADQLAAVSRQRALLEERVKQFEREQGPALTLAVGYAVTTDGLSPGILVGVQVYRLPLKKVVSVLTPW